MSRSPTDRLEELARELRILASEVRRYGVDSRDAATMFSFDVEQFQHNEDEA